MKFCNSIIMLIAVTIASFKNRQKDRNRDQESQTYDVLMSNPEKFKEKYIKMKELLKNHKTKIFDLTDEKKCMANYIDRLEKQNHQLSLKNTKQKKNISKLLNKLNSNANSTKIHESQIKVLVSDLSKFKENIHALETKSSTTELLNLRKQVDGAAERYISLQLEKEREVTEVTEKNLEKAEEDECELIKAANSLYKKLAEKHAFSNRQVSKLDEIICDLEEKDEALEETIVQRDGDLDVLEDQVEDLTKKLEKSNNELDAVKESLLQSGKLLKEWAAKSLNSTLSTSESTQFDDESIEANDNIDKNDSLMVTFAKLVL